MALIDTSKLTPLLAAAWAANDAWNAATDAQLAAMGSPGWESAPAVQAAQLAWMRAAADLMAEVRALVEQADPIARAVIRNNR
ncbi:hypothetical protein D3C77_89730 [compost metagenome]